MGLHEPYLKIWCQTAYCFEILDCDDQGHYRFQPYFEEILGDESSLNYRGGAINLAVNVTGERLRESLDCYRSGKINEYYSEERSEIVSDTTRVIHRYIGVYLSSMLPQDDPIRQKMSSGADFIDIGCGSGELLIHLAQLFKNIRENVSGKVYQSLKKEGKLLLIDFSYPESLNDFRNPAYEPGVVDQFDETCLGVVHLSAREQDEMLTRTGFKDIQRISMQGMDILNATK